MVDSAGKQTTRQEADLQMTPLIDVTFLLLIFFLCSIKFKLLDGKLATYLPRDEGVNRLQTEHLSLEKIEITLTRSASSDLGFTPSLNGVLLPDLDSLYGKVKSLYDRDPHLKAVCYSGPGIKHGQVVAVVNACLRAGLERIAFSGSFPQE